MNSKELSEQAEQRAVELNHISRDMKNVDTALEAIQTGEIGIMHGGEIYYIVNILDSKMVDAIAGVINANLLDVKNEMTGKLKKLLGIQQPFIPSYGTGNTEVFLSADDKSVPCPDPVEEKLNDILKSEAVRIEAPPEDKSLDKYPAKNKKYSGYPDDMTEELVKEMYIDKQMKIGDIADHFKVPYSKANNFISKHKLHRSHQEAKPESQPEKQPDDKESHS